MLNFHICMTVPLKATQNYFRKLKYINANDIAEL